MAPVESIQAVTPAAAAASQSDAKLRDAAKQFESVLVEQLAKQLQETAKPADDEDGESAASGFYAQLLPGALAQGVSDAGGLGLADQIYRSLKQKASS